MGKSLSRDEELIDQFVEKNHKINCTSDNRGLDCFVGVEGSGPYLNGWGPVALQPFFFGL